MKKTPVFETHVELGARMIDFGGWSMPVQYSGIIEEHTKVRESAGLFDVSHMGEIMITGKDALSYADYIVTNDLMEMGYGDVAYTPICYENGGCVDDVLVYCFGTDKVLLAVNASNSDKDYEWISENTDGYDVKVDNMSDSYAQLAVQGPLAQEILQEMTETNLEEIGFFKFREDAVVGGVKVLLSRTGYTGEDGFELYFDTNAGESVFSGILKAGGNRILPCGLGARDTLRMEACLPLYGHELTPEITPVQAGLKYFIKFTEKPFIGSKALLEETETKPERRIAGFEMTERGIPRNGYPVYDKAGEEIGYVTSGGLCPSLSKNMGLALIDRKYAKVGTEIFIGIRKKMVGALTVKKPFYKKKYKKQEDK